VIERPADLPRFRSAAQEIAWCVHIARRDRLYERMGMSRQEFETAVTTVFRSARDEHSTYRRRRQDDMSKTRAVIEDTPVPGSALEGLLAKARAETEAQAAAARAKDDRLREAALSDATFHLGEWQKLEAALGPVRKAAPMEAIVITFQPHIVGDSIDRLVLVEGAVRQYVTMQLARVQAAVTALGNGSLSRDQLGPLIETLKNQATATQHAIEQIAGLRRLQRETVERLEQVQGVLAAVLAWATPARVTEVE
jgi:hypothetical protein